MPADQLLRTFLPLIGLFAIMYFLLIRPQKKKEKQVNAMRSSVKVGDEILTIGGIYGKVIKTKEDRLTVEVGNDKTRFEITRWAVSTVFNAVAESKKEDKPAPEQTKEDKTDQIREAVESDREGKRFLRKKLNKENKE